MLQIYLDQHRQNGVNVHSYRRTLEGYLDYVFALGTEFIDFENVSAWIECTMKNLSPRTKSQRYNLLRRFSFWANAIDDRNTVLPRKPRPQKQRRNVVVLDDELVRRLMENCKAIPTPKGLSNHTAATMIGLMYATGLRIGEAHRLSRNDVNFGNMSIYIGEGKSPRDRVVPISERTKHVLKSYINIREQFFLDNDERFFLFDTGAVKSFYTFRRLFDKAAAAVITGETGLRPLPHDLRHSFAVRFLIRAYKNNQNMHEAVSKLTILMGHKSAQETYWYIHAVPELLALAMLRDDRAA